MQYLFLWARGGGKNLWKDDIPGNMESGGYFRQEIQLDTKQHFICMNNGKRWEQWANVMAERNAILTDSKERRCLAMGSDALYIKQETTMEMLHWGIGGETNEYILNRPFKTFLRNSVENSGQPSIPLW